MERRQFLKSTGATLAVAGGASTMFDPGPAAAQSATRSFRLSVANATITMIDGIKVDMLAFERRVPGPVIRVVEGEQVTITVRNQRLEAHGFEIPGVPGSRIASIPPGGTTSVTFTAPLAGSYMYLDNSHPSRHLYRLLGLHGAFVVSPRNGSTAAGSVTPYSLDRLAAEPGAPRVAAVFDALGASPRFPGRKWAPCPLDREFSLQERVWVFNQIDPRLNALVRRPIDPAARVDDFTPRYFTINGRSGFDLSDDESVVVKNYIGEPTLIRSLNAGLCHHATHIHGNHLLELAHSLLTRDGFVPVMGAPREGGVGEVVLHDSIWERDTWPTWPLQIRDMLLPLEVPPDIPSWQKFVDGTAQEPFPLRYVMHDHCEMGTTAAGGNYPQGAVTHWEILGPLNGRARA